jgi:hypothetical protein
MNPLRALVRLEERLFALNAQRAPEGRADRLSRDQPLLYFAVFFGSLGAFHLLLLAVSFSPGAGHCTRS